MDDCGLIHLSRDKVVEPGLDARPQIGRRNGCRGLKALDSFDILRPFSFGVHIPEFGINSVPVIGKVMSRHSALTRNGG